MFYNKFNPKRKVFLHICDMREKEEGTESLLLAMYLFSYNECKYSKLDLDSSMKL